MKLNTVKYVLAAYAVLMAAAGCRSQYEIMLNSADVDAKYMYANQLMELKKWRKAASMYESLSMQTSGTERDDTVRYYWAYCNYKDRDITTAEANFTSFLELYPMGAFSAEAKFLKLDCLFRSTYRYELDQNPTRVCIAAISEYVFAENPDSLHLAVCTQMLDELTERLNKKAFSGAYLYYKMEDYIAARVAFKNILKDNAETPYREDILYYIAKSAYKYAQNSVASKQQERYMDFADEYFNFVSELPESAYRKDLDQCYARATKVIGDKNAIPTDKEVKKESRKDKKLERQYDRRRKDIKI